MKKISTKTIAYTAVMLALLVAVQFVTKSTGQIVTGSCVNFILMICATVFGTFTSTVVAVVSPFVAFSLGIGTPIIQIVPFIALGNLSYVLLACLLPEDMNGAIKVVIASVVKFLVLFILVTKVVLPSLGLPEAKVTALTAAFSYTQLITALIGGFLAYVVAPRIKKAIK